MRLTNQREEETINQSRLIIPLGLMLGFLQTSDEEVDISESDSTENGHDNDEWSVNSGNSFNKFWLK